MKKKTRRKGTRDDTSADGRGTQPKVDKTAWGRGRVSGGQKTGGGRTVKIVKKKGFVRRSGIMKKAAGSF